MKRKILLTAFILSTGYGAFAQNTFPAKGNVGIGTNAPTHKLEVKGDAQIEATVITSSNAPFPNSSVLFSQKGFHNMFGVDGLFTTKYFGMKTDGNFTVMGGNVGIGTTNPDNVQGWQKVLELHGNDHAKLLVTSNTIKTGIFSDQTWGSQIMGRIGTESSHDLGLMAGYGNMVMTLKTTGNVGIGTTNPTTGLQLGNLGNEVVGKQINIPGTYNFERLKLGQLGNGNCALEMVNHININQSYGMRLTTSVDDGGQGLQFQYASPETSYETLKYKTGIFMGVTGNVGIGTIVPKEALSVNGKIRAKEVKVEAENWPDYVFDKGYKVGTLGDLEKYIKANKHLPGIADAKTIEENGIAVSETIKAQQKIIEELTLHLIEKEKEIKKLQDSNFAQENKSAAAEILMQNLLKRIISLEQNKK